VQRLERPDDEPNRPHRGHPIVVTIRPAIFNRHVLAFNIAGFIDRFALLKYSAKQPGFRVLEDRYGANLLAVAVPKGHARRRCPWRFTRFVRSRFARFRFTIIACCARLICSRSNRARKLFGDTRASLRRRRARRRMAGHQRSW
jgi:hypothetical protein